MRNWQKICGKEECVRKLKKFLNSLPQAKTDRKKSNDLWRKYNKSKIKEYNKNYYRKNIKHQRQKNSRVEFVFEEVLKIRENLKKNLEIKELRVELLEIKKHISKNSKIEIGIKLGVKDGDKKIFNRACS